MLIAGLPLRYSYTSGFSAMDYDSIKMKVGGFWDRFTDSAVEMGGWVGFILVVFGFF